MNITADNNLYSKNDSTCRLTPRQLIKYHMEHPEIPITDADIENLVFEFPKEPRWRANNKSVKQDNNLHYIN